jgi:hypothetical protein
MLGAGGQKLTQKHVLAGAADAPPTAQIGYDMNLCIDYVTNL